MGSVRIPEARISHVHERGKGIHSGVTEPVRIRGLLSWGLLHTTADSGITLYAQYVDHQHFHDSVYAVR